MIQCYLLTEVLILQEIVLDKHGSSNGNFF